MKLSFVHLGSFPAGITCGIALLSLLIYPKILLRQRLVLTICVCLLCISINQAQDFEEDNETERIEQSLAQGLVGTKAKKLVYHEIINGNTTGIASLNEFIGRVTIINFWAKWCPPCIKEMPTLENFHRENKDRDFLLVGITGHYRTYEKRDTLESLRQIKDILNKNEVSYLVLIEDLTYRNWYSYMANELPLTILIDKNGIIVDYKIGIKGTKKLLSLAKKMLGEN